MTLVERSGVFGRGVAYGTPRPERLLNVAAGKMSALPDEPEHFLAWARDAGHAAGEHDFVPRAQRGDHAQAVLAEARRNGARGRDRAPARSPRSPRGRPATTVLARAPARTAGAPALVSVGGRRLEADAVVLALASAARRSLVRRSRRGPPVLRRRPVGR